MELPENAGTFVEAVKADTRRLVDLGIWDIPTQRVETWFRQFHTEVDQFFGACLTDQVLFRSPKQFDALLKALFRGLVQCQINPNLHDLSLAEDLSMVADPRVRLVPVIREDDPPTKSGLLVLRRLQRLLGVKNEWLKWPWQAAEEAKSRDDLIIIFVDDFLGTGRQFTRFYGQWNFSDMSPSTRVIYAPAVAHVEGIKNIKEKFPKIETISAELLDERHSFFSEDVWRRLGQGQVSPDDARVWHDSFVKARNISLKSVKATGVGELALTFAFAHATPNNSLPMLWVTQEGGWQGLLER